MHRVLCLCLLVLLGGIFYFFLGGGGYSVRSACCLTRINVYGSIANVLSVTTLNIDLKLVVNNLRIHLQNVSYVIYCMLKGKKRHRMVFLPRCSVNEVVCYCKLLILYNKTCVVQQKITTPQPQTAYYHPRPMSSPSYTTNPRKSEAPNLHQAHTPFQTTKVVS